MGKTNNIAYNTAKSILIKLDSTRDASSTKALLANMRNSADKDISNNVDALAYVFSNLSYGEDDRGGELSYMEQAIFTAIQMYAIHQQSNVESVLKFGNDDENESREKKYKANIGDALATLRSDESESIDKRFNAMITATNFNKLSYHLRQMIKILKSKSDAKVDYAKLAEHLYWFMIGRKEEVRLSWARSYYKYRKNEEMEGEIKNEK
ncbi:CRISPR system Cascade subunit CasB [Ezakiella coagulans]|uniref:CRISPR system Cascade subunit CasB n=1 Tax=Ezakiella coagulans TaxID=46507 RepID=A0A2U1E6I3_9FIRM|nr:type I-E CRISPR-associated protein Cse2/CasB [Ezakiella coagulans]PVY95505.1 CRISPR system Cascade subunit CasB [Ezakiella coagulans]